MTDPRIQALLKMGRGHQVSTPGWQRILDSMNPEQRAFAADTRQGTIALAGRGGGKSFAMACKFHRVSAANPGQSAVFVAISATRARDILMPAIRIMNERYGTRIEERRVDNCAVWPNGYRLLFRGCKDANESAKRRGTPWAAAGWDECASIHSHLLEEDIHEAVEPRLVDLDGRWFAGGTPGPVQQGYWYKLSSGDNPRFPVYRWDARQNHHLPNVLGYFVDVLTRMQSVPDRKLWPSHCNSVLDLINDERCWRLLPATFVREYLGRWVLDLKALIYKLTARNTFVTLPIEPDYWTIGCDLGAHSEETPDLDYAALAVCCSQKSLPNKWFPRVEHLSDITIESLAAKICQWRADIAKAWPNSWAAQNVGVHIDSASAGKLVERTFQRMGIPIQAAEKGPKLRRIQFMQSGIANGTCQFHITDTMDLREEATALVWNKTRDNHHENCSDDAWDATLMAAMPHFGDYRPEPTPVEEGSEEWQRQQEMAEYEAALAEAMGQDEVA